MNNMFSYSTGCYPQSSCNITQVDLPLLQHKATEFYTNGLATTTRSTYTAGQSRFITFCRAIKTSPMPASEATLIASHLATQGISHTTIKVYLAAIRYMHTSAGRYASFNTHFTPHLQLTLGWCLSGSNRMLYAQRRIFFLILQLRAIVKAHFLV